MIARGLLFAASLAFATSAASQDVVHGSADAFRAPGIALAWAIERGKDEATTAVGVRIVADPAKYGWVEVRGVDPFTQATQTLAAGRALGGTLDVRSPRARFADTPRTEWRLFANEAAAGNAPALTVYYVGVPDTTPEFADAAKLVNFLKARTAR